MCIYASFYLCVREIGDRKTLSLGLNFNVTDILFTRKQVSYNAYQYKDNNFHK